MTANRAVTDSTTVTATGCVGQTGWLTAEVPVAAVLPIVPCNPSHMTIAFTIQTLTPPFRKAASGARLAADRLRSAV